MYPGTSEDAQSHEKSCTPARQAKAPGLPPDVGARRLMPAPRSEATDEVLMVSYQRGDREAFAELVRRYETPIYNFSLRQLRSREAAEEITQDVFLRVVRRASQFKHEARFSTWLYTIARNLTIDELRKRRHRRHPSLDQPSSMSPGAPPLLDSVEDISPTGNAERSAAASQVAERIVEAVEALPEEQREVFLLREIANLPFADIAQVTGAGENTVKSRMRYALERLQQALSEFEEYARALR